MQIPGASLFIKGGAGRRKGTQFNIFEKIFKNYGILAMEELPLMKIC
jgi:hypothetical protein